MVSNTYQAAYELSNSLSVDTLLIKDTIYVYKWSYFIFLDICQNSLRLNFASFTKCTQLEEVLGRVYILDLEGFELLGLDILV